MQIGQPHYLLTRFILLRFLAGIYLVAFLVAAEQFDPLLGSHGLLPIELFLGRVATAAGSPTAGFIELPSLFWISSTDAAVHAVIWAGLILSVISLLGITNAAVQFGLWGLYLSIVQVGQLFYGYGWETQLLETGFLAIFLCPLLRVAPFATEPPTIVIMLFRWLVVRIMWGAALIKLRGDPCWRDFTCLMFHYETQPIPNPISWWFHSRGAWFHVMGVGWNHFVELICPVFAFGPRRARHFAGICFVLFQLILIVSGNLSFLNWLTIVPALACFDDSFWQRSARQEGVTSLLPRIERGQPVSQLHQFAAWGLAVVVAILSVQPTLNLISSHQLMNYSFNRLHLVNTYGAFGAVGRVRNEVVIEGTDQAEIGPDTRWDEYEFPCKPGDVARRPCVISPYHYRADWQIWFAAMSDINHEPWLVHLIYKLLRGDPGVKSLLARDPFPSRPPHYIRALLYRYEFTKPEERTSDWWRRTLLGVYLPPVTADDANVRRYLERAIGIDLDAGYSP